MTLVNDIWADVSKILGNGSDALKFRRLTEAVELVANKGDFNTLQGTMDVCVSSRIVTLPPEIENITALSMAGRPAMARDELYLYHLNGMGMCGQPIRYEWIDMANACTYREIACAGKLWGYCVEEADENCELWVYGFDHNQNWIRTEVSTGIWRDGYKVPVTVNSQSQPADAPNFARITSVRKGVTVGPIRLTILNGVEEILLGIYQSYETVPQYRRIQLSHCVDWVRIKFRRRNFEVRSRYDILPIAPRQAVVMALRALKAYDEPNGFAVGEAFESTAVRWAHEKQFVDSPEVVHPIQVSEGGALTDRGDHID